MVQNKENWKVGEIVNLTWTSDKFKTSGETVYYHFFGSRFLCIKQPDDENKVAIFVKVLGKTSPADVMMVGGEPFCKDQKDDLFTGVSYSSFRFPKLDDLKEVLQIIRDNPEFKSCLEEAGMHINLDSTFWVRESIRGHLLQKKPQIYNAGNGCLSAISNDTPHYRLAIVFFTDGKFIC